MPGCIQPMSSPMMKRMLGFWSCAWAKGMSTGAAVRHSPRTEAPSVRRTSLLGIMLTTSSFIHREDLETDREVCEGATGHYWHCQDHTGNALTHVKVDHEPVRTAVVFLGSAAWRTAVHITQQLLQVGPSSPLQCRSVDWLRPEQFWLPATPPPAPPKIVDGPPLKVRTPSLLHAFTIKTAAVGINTSGAIGVENHSDDILGHHVEGTISLPQPAASLSPRPG